MDQVLEVVVTIKDEALHARCNQEQWNACLKIFISACNAQYAGKMSYSHYIY